MDNSVGIVTALCPHVGYAKSAALAKEALKSKVPVRKLILDEGLLNEAELNEILDVKNMTEPGISGKELLLKK